MRPYSTHTLEMDREEILVPGPSEGLAIVDLESYPAFVGREVDRLDMMAHLQRQMSALTATAWRAPHKNLQIRLLLTGDHRAMQRRIELNQGVFASGWVRTHRGQLCLTHHDRLYDCARHRTHGLLREERLPKDSPPHILNVPPGLYSVDIFYHASSSNGNGSENGSTVEPKAQSTIILRHYAFPPPRLAPTRLPGFMPQTA